MSVQTEPTEQREQSDARISSAESRWRSTTVNAASSLIAEVPPDFALVIECKVKQNSQFYQTKFSKVLCKILKNSQDFSTFGAVSAIKACLVMAES